jgi:hypothetical protein
MLLEYSSWNFAAPFSMSLSKNDSYEIFSHFKRFGTISYFRWYNIWSAIHRPEILEKYNRPVCESQILKGKGDRLFILDTRKISWNTWVKNSNL